jgi:plasmid stabilization system protein ParE
MASKPFRFHPDARVDLRDSARWYREHNAEIAIEFRRAVADAVRGIVQAPQRWPTHRDGTRKFVMRRFPFSVIYLDELSEVVIVAVAHPKRRPGFWKERI